MDRDAAQWGRFRWWLHHHGRILWFVPCFVLLALGFYMAELDHPWWGFLCIFFALFCAEAGR